MSQRYPIRAIREHFFEVATWVTPEHTCDLIYAGNPDMAEPLVERFAELLRGHGVPTQTGQFGASAAAGQGAALQRAGDARASGTLGIGNALGNALNQYAYQQGYGGGGVTGGGGAPQLGTPTATRYVGTL